MIYLYIPKEIITVNPSKDGGTRQVILHRTNTKSPFDNTDLSR